MVKQTPTATRVFVGAIEKKSLNLGVIKKGDLIRFETEDLPKLIPLFNTNLKTYPLKDRYGFAVELTGEQLYAGNNVVIRFVNNLGRGHLELHSIGMTRIGYRWMFVKTIIPIHFYSIAGNTSLFTSSLINQKSLLNKLEEIVKEGGTSNIPNYALYKEFVPELNTVKWFDSFRLIGSISTPDGDVLFHIKDCKVGHTNRPFRSPFPKNGQKVLHLVAEPCTGHFSKKATLVIY